MPKRIPRYAKSWVQEHGGLVSVIVVTYLCLAVTLVFALTAADVANSSKDTTKRVCRGQNEIRVSIRALIVQSDATLGKKGSAGYAYYVRHPAELAAAHKQNAQTIDTFKPLKCN